MNLKDCTTGKIWELDFISFSFPGLQNGGYRIEGFHKTGETEQGDSEGEFTEFCSIILDDGKLKLIHW